MGALRISHDTWLLVRGAFACQAQPPLQVKGSAEPLQTYLVQHALPSAQRVAARGLHGVPPPLVGRQAEAEQVRALPDLARQTGRLQAITLVGEPGVGKSRLLLELQAGRATAGSRAGPMDAAGPGQRRVAAATLWTAAQPAGLATPVADSVPLEQAKAHLVDGLLPWLTGTADTRLAHAQALGQIIGLDFSGSPALQGLGPTALRQRAFAALTSHLRALGTAGRVPVLLLEDLHWADNASLDFVQTLFRTWMHPRWPCWPVHGRSCWSAGPTGEA